MPDETTQMIGLITLWVLLCVCVINGIFGRYDALDYCYRFVRFFQSWTNEAAAKHYVEACHGDLPTAEEFRREGHSVGFSLAMLPYFVAADERRKTRSLQTQWERLDPYKNVPASAVFIDPETEDDCPECANGVDGRDHECRTGWKDHLRAVRAEWDAARSKPCRNPYAEDVQQYQNNEDLFAQWMKLRSKDGRNG